MSDPTREALRRAANRIHGNESHAGASIDRCPHEPCVEFRALSTTPAPAVTYEVVAAAIRAVGLPYIESKAREGEVDWIAGRLADALSAALSTTPAPLDVECDSNIHDDPRWCDVHEARWPARGANAGLHCDAALSTTPAPISFRGPWIDAAVRAIANPPLDEFRAAAAEMVAAHDAFRGALVWSEGNDAGLVRVHKAAERLRAALEGAPHE